MSGTAGTTVLRGYSGTGDRTPLPYRGVPVPPEPGRRVSLMTKILRVVSVLVGAGLLVYGLLSYPGLLIVAGSLFIRAGAERETT